MSHTSFFRQKHRARQLALQALYQWQLTQASPNMIIKEFEAKPTIKKANIAYFKELVTQIPVHCVTLDAALEPYLNRPLHDLTHVERVVLRLAAYELLYHSDLPYKVVINEAIKLSKQFGTIEGFKFVNGVLDKMRK